MINNAEHKNDDELLNLPDVVDRCNFSRITCLVIGIASVFSYATLFAGGDYFKQKHGHSHTVTITHTQWYTQTHP